MVRSMTGYGRGVHESHDRVFTVEIKSVNHRYNDISIKMPRFLNSVEDKIRKILSKYIFRGKTDVYVSFETYSAGDVDINVDHTLAKAYVDVINNLKETYSLKGDDTVELIAKFPDVITVNKIQEADELLWETLKEALNKAVTKFVEMREAEGMALSEDIIKKAEVIEKIVESIKERSPLVVENYRVKLNQRLSELLDSSQIDESRLAAEITIFADKCCIDEEITRLKSHICQLREIISNGGLVGRKLDFLVQEMNREANTIASKSNDIVITNATIELKSEIEKVREQIQNIE